MTNNYEDLDQPELGHEELPPPPRGFAGNLMEAWRTRPLFKLIVLITIIGGIIAASLGVFSGSTQTADTTKLPKPPEVKGVAGGPATPYFNKQVQEADAERVQKAIDSGGSAMVTPIGQPANMEMGANSTKNDPLNELRTETERLKAQLAQAQQQPKQAAPQQQPQQFDDTLAQAMQRELQQMMDSWKPAGAKEVTVTKEKDLAETSSAAAAAQAAQAAQAQAQAIPKTLVPAGTVSYGQLLTEANSDIPGPILAQILSGPLSGARAVGNFQTENDYNVLQFNLVNFHGKDYQLNAVALDPDTTLGGLATEVDERLLTRVILPAAAGFLQGMGSALSQGSSSVVTNGTTTIVSQSGKGIREGMFQGLSQGAQTAGEFFQNQANNTKTLVRVAAGTPIGVFFVASVLDTNTQQQQPYGYGYPGYPGYPGYGYPGYGVPGAPGSVPGAPGTLPAGYYPGYSAGVPGQQSPGNYSGAAQNLSYPGANVPYPPMASTPAMTPGYTSMPGNTTGIGTTTFGH